MTPPPPSGPVELVLDGLGLRHSDGVHEVLDGTLLCALGPVHASHLAALLELKEIAWFSWLRSGMIAKAL